MRSLYLPLLVVLLLFAIVIGVRFFGAGPEDEILVRAKPGARPVYVERPLAQHALAVSKRAAEMLLREEGTARVEGAALFKVGNEDWLAACALLRKSEVYLRLLALDGQAGVRPENAVAALRAVRDECERLRTRFAEAEILQRGRVPEEMRAFLDDLASLLAALPAVAT